MFNVYSIIDLELKHIEDQSKKQSVIKKAINKMKKKTETKSRYNQIYQEISNLQKLEENLTSKKSLKGKQSLDLES